MKMDWIAGVLLGFFIPMPFEILLFWLIFSRRENKKLKAEKQEVLKEISEIKESVGKIVEGQRLSIILKFEPSSLKIDQADFELKKENIRKSLFVNGTTDLVAKKALAILLVNGDEKAVANFLNEIIDKL